MSNKVSKHIVEFKMDYEKTYENLVGKIYDLKQQVSSLKSQLEQSNSLVNSCQGRIRKQKEAIDKIKSICNNVPYDWSVCGIDVVHKIEKVLEEVEHE